ncbi:MAG: hypothetical protein MRY59_01390 [Aquisalinus sp.]|nr:hypothetical protein [Aquisalinus sp.]
MSRLLKSLSTGLCALALVSCAGNPLTTSSRLNNQLDVVPGGYEPGDHDPVAKAAFWGTRYDRNPNDADVAVTFSQALRVMGSNEEALTVMTRTYRQAGNKPDVALEYGKVLIANDRAFEAIRPLEQAILTGKGEDWRSYSAYGVALDKIGEHKAARQQYDMALKIKPNSHVVLNNKGLSYALSGNLTKAEQTLRFAAATTAGTPTVRQNLALVLGFKGDSAEAERLARSDLPPRIADNNVAYFRSLTAQPAHWQAFAGDNVEMPSFDAPVATSSYEAASVIEAPTESVTEPVMIRPETFPVPALPEEPDGDPTPLGDILSSLSVPAEEPPARTIADGIGSSEWGGIAPPVAIAAPVTIENTTLAAEDLANIVPEADIQEEKQETPAAALEGKTADEAEEAADQDETDTSEAEEVVELPVEEPTTPLY